MGYDANGNYTGVDTEFDPGAGASGPLGNLTKADVKRAGKVGIDSVLDIPADMVATAKMGNDAFVSLQQYLAQRVPVISDPKKRQSYGQIFSDQSAYGDGAHAAREDAANAAKTFATEHPEAPLSEVAEVGTQRLKDNESGLNSGIRRYKEATDDLTGAPHDEDRSNGERILGAIVPALIPGGEIAALNNAGRVGKGVNAVLRETRIPGADLLDPRTAHFTPGGVAANASAGAAGTAALSVLQGDSSTVAPTDVGPVVRPHVAIEDQEKSVITYPNDPDSNGAPTTVVDAGTHDDSPSAPKVATNVGLANLQLAALPFIAALGIRYHGGVKPPKFNPMSITGGPGHVEAPHIGVSDKAYALDEQAPLEKDIATAHNGNQALGRELGSDDTIHVRSNVGIKVEKAINTGQLDNVQQAIPTISGIGKRILADEQRYGPQFTEQLNKGMIYRTEYADRMHRINTLDDTVQNNDMLIRAKQNLALQTTDPKQASAYYKEIAELSTVRAKAANEMNTLKADAPDTRLGLTDVDNVTLKQTVDAFEQDPRMKSYMDDNEAMNRGVLDYLHNNRVLSKEDYNYLGSNKAETHVLMKNDPYLDAQGKPLTGISRMWAIFKKDMAAITDDLYTMDKESRVPGSTPLMRRDPAEKLSDRVNTPVNWLDAKHAEIDRAVRYVSRQNFTRDTVEAIMRGPKSADVLTPKLAPGHNPLWSAEAVSQAVKDGRIDPARDTMVNYGGKFQVVQFKDIRSKTTLDQPPMLRIPVVSQLTHMFSATTTGILKPAFAAKRVMYDAGIFGMNRAAHEPHGIEGMYEQARRGVQAATGYSLPESPQWANLASRFGVPIVGQVMDQSAIYTVSFMGAMESFLRQSQKQIGLGLANDLAARSPFFEALNRVSPQYMQNLGNSMIKSYADSLYATAANLQIVHPNEFKSLRTNKRDYERMTGRALKKFANNPIGMAFVEASNIYRSAMSSFEQSVQYTAFTSMANREMMKRGVQRFDQLPSKVQKQITRYARTTGGDFARVPGASGAGKIVQGMNASIPYNNVMLRSIQSIWRAASDHPAIFGGAVAGIVGARVMAEWMLTNWDDNAHRHWFEETPHWERIQYQPSLTAKGFMAWYNGEPFKPEHLSKTLLFPEARTPGIVVSEALRAMGMYGKRSFGSAINDPNLVSVLDRAAEGLKQGFAPMTPPGLQALAAASGTKVDLGNIFNQIPAIADSMVNGGAAQTRPGMLDPTQAIQQNRQGSQTAYNPTSEISKNTVGVVQALIGSTANTALDVFDTYGQRRTAGDGVGAAAIAALKSGYETEKEYSKKQITQTTGNMLLQKNDKTYTGTPAQEYVRDARSTYSLVSGKNAVIKKKEPIDNGGLLDNLISTLRFDGVKDPDLKEMSKEFFELNTESKKIAANRRLKPDERFALDKEVAQKLTDVTRRQAAHLQELEKGYIDYYGEEFKQRFGKDLSFAQMRAVITKAGNAVRYQPSSD